MTGKTDGMDSWRVLTSRSLLERRWLTVTEQHIRLPTGVEIDEFHLVETPDWVAILCLTETGNVVLVDQYRHGIRAVSRELPAGVIDGGETPLQAAQRELLEETGYASEQWQPLLTVATEPSRHTNHAHFFFASHARRIAEPHGDLDENIEVELLPPDDLINAVERGDLVHGVHLAAILLAHRRGWLG